jgi:ATP-binding cassette subfamily C protein LapB
VRSLVDRVLGFDRGRLIADGPREEIVARMKAPPPPPQGAANAAV